MSLPVIENKTPQLQLQKKPYPQLPERSQLAKIARLYAKAFADLPWNEYKVCEKKHYIGKQQWELTRSPYCSDSKCGKPLNIAYPEDATIVYITKEITMSHGKLVTFEDEGGEVYAAGWGYACTIEELQAKYDSDEMKKKVVDKIKIAAGKVQIVFYLSEIMVDSDVQRRGIATKITNDLIETAQSLTLKLVMRTHGDSPMARIAKNTKMFEVIGLKEDTENPNRVLYIKI